MKHTLFTLLLLTAISTVTAAEAWREIKAVNAPGAAFTDAAQIRFKAPANTQFTLTDWQGKKLGKFTSGKEGLLSLPRLGAGFYRLSAPGMTGTRDFMVFMPGKGKDSFTEINTSLIWCTPWTTSPAVCLPLLKNGGFGSPREFVGWKEIWPEKKQFRWEKYVAVFRRIHDAGFKVTCCYRDSAYWARYKKGPGDKTVAPAHFPDDLIACYQFNKHLCEKLGPYTGLWEFWNEPDGGFSDNTAWDYAAAMKAAYLGFKDSAPDIPVALGAMCLFPVRQYVAAALANDLEYYFDAFNYHTYRPLSDYPELMRQINALLAKTGNAEKPIFFTETGTNSEGSAKLVSSRKGHMEHDFAQELIVAEFHPKSILQLKMLGVSKISPFTLPPFNEINGSKAWGLLRQDFTVKPSFAAISVMNKVLGGSILLGKAESSKGTTVYLLNSGEKQILAYWAHSGLDIQKDDSLPAGSMNPTKKIVFSVPNGKYCLIGPFGEETAVVVKDKKLTLQADRFVRYAIGPAKISPVQKALVRKNKGALPFTGDKTVIIKPLLSKDFEVLSSRDCVEFHEGIKKASMDVELFNLSDREKTGTIAYDCGGIKGTAPGMIKIAPWTKTTVKLAIPVSQKNEGTIVLSGTFNGKKISRCIIPFISNKTLKSVPMPRTALPAGWRVNSSGKMKISRGEDPGSVRFDIDFTGVKNCWAAPVFALRKPAEYIGGAVGLSFDIKIISDPKQILWPTIWINSTKTHSQGYRIKAQNGWERITVRFEGNIDLANATAFQIALGCRKGNLSYAIRNVVFDYIDLEKTARKQLLERAVRSDAWRKSSSGKMKIYNGKEPGEVRFDIDFTGVKNRWAAPGIPLLLPQETLRGAIGMTFEIKVNGNPSDTRWPGVFFFGTDKLNIRESFILPGKKWTQVILPFSHLKTPEKVTIFQIGLSGKKDKLSYSIRNIGFYFK